MKSFPAIFVFFFSSLVARHCLAEDAFSWHGFLSQGISQSIDSDFIHEDDEISFDLTELGINMRYDMNASLAVVGQAVYLNGGNRYERGARIDYLFVDWRLPDMENWTANINLGRFKSPHWLYSATRDVPQTRSTIILPQSIYFDNFRDVALGSDGVLLQLYRSSDEGNLKINWSYGSSPMSSYQTKALLGEFAQGEVKQDYAHQFSVFWQPPSLDWQLGASWLDSDFTYHPSANENLFEGGRTVRLYTLSAVYYAENWEFNAELQRNHSRDFGGYSPAFFDENKGEGGYAQIRYMLNSQFTLTLGYDMYVSDRNDRDGEKLEAATGGVIPAYFGYEKTATVGVQWDPRPNWRIQAEHHWVNGAGRLTSIPGPQNTPDTAEYWRMWAVQVMYWF